MLRALPPPGQNTSYSACFSLLACLVGRLPVYPELIVVGCHNLPIGIAHHSVCLPLMAYTATGRFWHKEKPALQEGLTGNGVPHMAASSTSN